MKRKRNYFLNGTPAVASGNEATLLQSGEKPFFPRVTDFYTDYFLGRKRKSSRRAVRRAALSLVISLGHQVLAALFNAVNK